MIEFFQLMLLGLAGALSLVGIGSRQNSTLDERVWRIAAKSRLVTLAVVVTTLLGSMIVSGVLHEPVPLVHDEFSNILIGDTLAAGWPTLCAVPNLGCPTACAIKACRAPIFISAGRRSFY